MNDENHNILSQFMGFKAFYKRNLYIFPKMNLGYIGKIFPKTTLRLCYLNNSFVFVSFF